MAYSFDTDNAADVAALMNLKAKPSLREYFPRATRYGTPGAERMGLEPVESAPNIIIPESGLKDAIEQAHADQSFAMYYQLASWMPKGSRYMQDGIGYCWTWGGSACLMDLFPIHDMTPIYLAPVSMGYLVGWADRGFYLDGWIGGAREKGVALAVNKNVNDLTRSASYWKDAKRVKLGKVWDTNNQAGDKTMLLHCASILCYGRPLYVAYNWWGHALEMVALKWTPGTYLNITAVLRNSHNEDDVIELTGSRCIPSEAYGLISYILEGDFTNLFVAA